MGLGRDGREGQFGEGLGDAHDGLKLPHCDGDRGPRVGLQLGGVDLLADRDEVRGELLCGGFAEAGGAASGRKQWVSKLNCKYVSCMGMQRGQSSEGSVCTYDLQ